jgi:hypothetical protein
MVTGHPPNHRLTELLDLQPYGCGLCSAPPTDVVYVELWEAWQHPSSSARLREIENVLRRDKRGWTVEAVQEHFAHHSYVQPVPSKARATEQAQQALDFIQARKNDLEILRFIGQAGMVTAKQLAAEFWPHASKKSRNDQILAHKKLKELAHHHLVTGVSRTGEKGKKTGKAPKVWYLARAGAELLDVLGPQVRWVDRELWVSRPQKGGHIPHNLGVTDIFIDLQASTPDLVELSGVAIRAQAFPGNFWAAKHLSVAVQLPLSEVTVGGRRGRDTRMIPDGFQVLGVDANVRGKGASPAFDSFALPCFIENDHGWHPVKLTPKQLKGIKAGKLKAIETTSGQIAAYLALAKSRAAAARFPQLDVDGYSPPLLYVTSNSRKADTADGQRQLDINRVLSVKKAAVEHIAKHGYEGQPPIFIAARSEIAAQGFNAPVFGLWDDEDLEARKPLFQRLAAGNMTLIKAGVLDASTRLTIDPDGAAWKGERR